MKVWRSGRVGNTNVLARPVRLAIALKTFTSTVADEGGMPRSLNEVAATPLVSASSNPERKERIWGGHRASDSVRPFMQYNNYTAPRRVG